MSPILDEQINQLKKNQRLEMLPYFGNNEQVSTVIDYHVMRSCLRVSLIVVINEEQKKN